VWGLTPYRFPTTIRTVRPDHGTSGSYTVELTTRQWQIIDATMDNEVSVEAQNGDLRGVVDSGHQVRVAGWDQVACRTPGVPGSGSWPPDGQVVSVTLSSEQWTVVNRRYDRS
jgi:hypothetical protein